jgi:hypothetical protein
MSDLRTNAAKAAGRTFESVEAPVASEQAVTTTAIRPADPEPLEMPDLGESPADFDQVPVQVAWMRVMREVREIRKDGLYNGGGTRYNFRGVDAAMNIFGAAIRKHGVVVFPSQVKTSYRDTKTTKGNAVRECTVEVVYTIMGPKGDSFTGMGAGESLDSADKGTAKAMSVALRVFLLQAGMVPTESRDPDADRHERGEAEVRTPESYIAEAKAPETSKQRLLVIYNEMKRHGLLDAQVMGNDDEPVQAGPFIIEIGKSRA